MEGKKMPGGTEKVKKKEDLSLHKSRFLQGWDFFFSKALNLSGKNVGCNFRKIRI